MRDYSKLNQSTGPNTSDFKTVNNTIQGSPQSEYKNNKKYINIVTSITENTIENNNLNIVELD